MRIKLFFFRCPYEKIIAITFLEVSSFRVLRMFLMNFKLFDYEARYINYKTENQSEIHRMRILPCFCFAVRSPLC